MKQKSNIKMICIIAFIVVLVLGYFYYVSNVRDKKTTETDAKATKVQEVIMKDLETRYPPTPKEVVKFYSQISQCLYNEVYTDEELREMAIQMQKMYDDELAAINPLDKYIEDLKFDIQSMKEKSCTISSYATSASTDVDYFTEDGFEWARLHCVYSIRAGSQMAPASDQLFLLRKDSVGHWRIYGWMLAKDTIFGGEVIHE